MLYNGDIEAVEKAVDLGFRDQDSSNAWRRIKKFVEVAQNTPTNTQKLSATQIAADMEQWAEHLDQYSNESTFCRIHQWKRQLQLL